MLHALATLGGGLEVVGGRTRGHAVQRGSQGRVVELEGRRRAGAALVLEWTDAGSAGGVAERTGGRGGVVIGKVVGADSDADGGRRNGEGLRGAGRTRGIT